MFINSNVRLKKLRELGERLCLSRSRNRTQIAGETAEEPRVKPIRLTEKRQLQHFPPLGARAVVASLMQGDVAGVFSSDSVDLAWF